MHAPEPLSLDPGSGWLSGARRLDSPNADERPPGTEIDLVVVHGISLPPGEFGTGAIDAFFANTLDVDLHEYFRTIADLAVSSHVLIARDGALTQYVPFHRRAWHAGESSFAGRARCNDYSVGIEMEGCDDVPYETAQYESLARLARLLMETWPAITPDRIVGHCDIAPGRKTDPGHSFDWEYFSSLLA